MNKPVENKANPANAVERSVIPKDFQPMSAGVRKLEVPERPGFHRRWIRSDAGRIAKAQRAGYRFVDADAVDLNNFDLGGDAKESGNTDLGTRVSVISGDGADATGQPGRLYLMECPIEYYEASRSIIDDRNEAIAETLRGGNAGRGQNGESSYDAEKRYTKGSMPDLFTPKYSR